MVFSTNLEAKSFKQLQTRLYKYSLDEKVLIISLKWASKFILETSMTPRYLYCFSYDKTINMERFINMFRVVPKI